MSIIGRVHEQTELKKHFMSGKPEFVAIVGRRRVGKTFLVIVRCSERRNVISI